MTPFLQRFQEYFARPVAETAAKSLADGAEIQIHIRESSGEIQETFTFTREGKKNKVITGPAASPQLSFFMTPSAAEQVLSDPSEDIGAIGVGILKLIVSTDANKKVSVKFHAGFLTLFNKGYFGVLTAGGSQFAAFLAARGLNGMGAIKAALGKMKSE
jgi:hypothetical protein